jgi:peptidoglycan/xylan/chitin deacetylase (PgdA/CDA1 family)
MAKFFKKDRLAHLLKRSRAFWLQRQLGLLPRDQFVVLTYHRIVDLDPRAPYPFDEELVSASAAEFDWQMGFLAANFRPERLGTLLAMARAGRRIPAGSVAVTFDDGFIDNYAVAFPILRKHKVPATFFVTTDFVEHNKPIWFEVVAYAYLNVAPNSIRHTLLAQAAPSSPARAVRIAELGQIMRTLKKVSDEERAAFVSHVLSLVDQDGLTQDWLRFGGAMRWEHVAEMAKANCEIGSHTVSHPILSQTHGQVLLRELAGSKRILEEKVGTSVDLLAYPVGGRAHFSPEVVSVAQSAGYKFGISYIAGVNRREQIDPFCVYRHTVERYTTRERFEAQLCLPKLFT